ncbi:hypothetical protein FPV16_15220 [Methylobacterium sp. W2]|nr:hypothetical protein [Methylobacterium sp. W2]
MCDLFGDGPHLTPTLSFQEREPVAPLHRRFTVKGTALGQTCVSGPCTRSRRERGRSRRRWCSPLPTLAHLVPSRGQRGSPLLEGEGQGEVCDLSGDGPHLTPTLSFQEREHVAPLHRRFTVKGTALGQTCVSGPCTRSRRERGRPLRRWCSPLPTLAHLVPSRGQRGSPLLEGERQGEVCDSSGDGLHLTPALSFQERETGAPLHRRFTVEETALGQTCVSGPCTRSDRARG